MKYLDLTLPTVAENLALDEALLEQCPASGDLLRIWEVDQPAVVVGRASRVAQEVDQEACRRADVPVLRRCSGGAAVVLGPGCLVYSVVLATSDRPDLQVIDRVHRFVLGRVQQALQSLDLVVQIEGTSDLTWQGHKVSGNSLRCRRDALLYHGTLLYAAEIPRIAACLNMPPRQPDYRQHRTHEDFLANLPTSAEALREALRRTWDCRQSIVHWPRAEMARLVAERYGCADWNFSR